MPIIIEEEICENTGRVIEHIWNVCKHCGTKVYDLENAIWVEWWDDEECGCHREVEA